MKLMTQDAIKKNLGEKAAALIEDGMLVGLGTGSTSACFIESLIKRCQEGLRIKAISSSFRSLEQAKKGGIPVYDINLVETIDMTVDGADEIDPFNRMIKGGGGALVREKILASSSKKMVVIVDETKLVKTLGQHPLPIEIIPFCYLTTISKIRKAGFDGSIRLTAEGSIYLTDTGNYIFDINTPRSFPDPEQVHYELSILPGVVETGFFFNLPVHVLVGYKDGSIEMRQTTQRRPYG